MGRSQYTDIQSNDFKDFISVHYSDSDLSVCFNLSDSVRGDKAISLDSFLFMACIDGEISGEVDANRYTLRPNNIIVCRPNRQMSNISSTDNFKCIAITVSQQMLLSILPMNERLFNSNIHFAGYPVVNIDDSTDAGMIRSPVRNALRNSDIHGIEILLVHRIDGCDVLEIGSSRVRCPVEDVDTLILICERYDGISAHIR